MRRPLQGWQGPENGKDDGQLMQDARWRIGRFFNCAHPFSKAIHKSVNYQTANVKKFAPIDFHEGCLPLFLVAVFYCGGT